MSSAFLFNEFIESGLSESISPFLTPTSRRWGKNLSLKASIAAAFLLLFSFLLSFHSGLQTYSHLSLVFVYFLAGLPSLIHSIEDIVDLVVNIDVLMTLAAFLSVLIGSGMEGGLLLVLYSISGAIEESVTAKAKSTLSHLRTLAPPQAWIIAPDGSLYQRSVKDVQPDQKILIKSGEIAPLDGIVVEGISNVSLVHLTGENVPVMKQVGDLVPAGARNQEGRLVLQVTRTSTESTLARLITLITQASEAKPRFQRFIDSVSQNYALLIILLATFFALSFPFLFSIPFLGVEGSIYRALTFLIAASPCALVIAIPIGYMSAISVCARKGILLKGGIVLDALASCKTMAFDKTGTLTIGELSLVKLTPIQPLSDARLQELLSLALSLERNATHPIAKAICLYAQNLQCKPLPVTDFKTIPGYGVEGNYRGEKLYIGRPDYLNIPLKEHAEGGLIAIFQAGADQIVLHFQDQARPKMRQMLQNLQKKFNLQLLMLTGDHRESAQVIANEVGIQDVRSELTPEEKLRLVSQLSENQGLAMVGDGINDAPALARATVGISMGKVGSTTAVDASDIVLLHDNIELLDWLMAKAHHTKRVILENVSVAFAAIAFASIPALFGLVPLWLAVLLHEGGTVVVGLNSLRLLKK